MTAELASHHLVTPEEYLRGEDAAELRHEYVNGRVYAMAGARLRHNRIVSAIDRSLGARLEGTPCEPVVLDLKLKIEAAGDLRFYYPDAYVICDQADDDLVAHSSPVMVIEVISGSTRRIDEGEKLQAYTKLESLQAYLIVETERPLVVAFRREGETFARETYAGLEATVPLPFLQIELPLSEVYARVDFAAAGDEQS